MRNHASAVARGIRFFLTVLLASALAGCFHNDDDLSTNQSPVADAGQDQTISAIATATLDGSGSSDSDGSIASFSWTQTAGPSVTLTGADTATASFTAPAVGASTTLDFELTVTDNDGATASDTVQITVAALPPSKPTLTVSIIDIKTLQFDWTGGDEAELFKLMVNPDGASGFTQDGPDLPSVTTASPSTTREIPVHLLDWANASYFIEACNSIGCTASDEIDLAALVIEDAIGYLKASNTDINDGFGRSVAISGDGNTIVVSTSAEDSAATGIDGDQADNSASASGAVYVFVKDAIGAWAQQAYVKASNPGQDDQFGTRLALSADGNTLAVSAFGEDSAATGIDTDSTGASAAQTDNTAGVAGAVYLFRRDGAGTWAQEAYVKASNTDAGDAFGGSVTLSADGNTLAVGATGEASNATGIDGNEADNSIGVAGAVYLFRRDGAGTWAQEAYVKASNTGAGDGFGASTALDSEGNLLAVGAIIEASAATGIDTDPTGASAAQTDNTAGGSGAAYVFRRDGAGVWAQEAYIKASNTGAGDQFGRLTLNANGDTLAVGAFNEDSAATGINGDETDESAADSGAVYVFTHNGTAWSQQAYLKASNTEAGDTFSGVVRLSTDGNLLAVSSTNESSAATGIDGDQSDNSALGSGAAYLFARDGSTWQQIRYLKASNTETLDEFGIAAISGDGNTLVIVASDEGSAATGVNGDQSDNLANRAGAAYVY